MPDILPRHQFLKQLQRERRRSDRFKAPLSIALFRFDDSDAATSDCVDDGLRLIHRSMRETDILGYLNNNLVAILLPHTNAQGAQKFIQKVAGRADPSRYACTAGTYPDRVFDSLADGARKPPELDVLFLDDRATPRFVNLIKRGIDILGATTAIILLSPVMLGTAAAIAITSPGPVIYRQKRLGRRGVPFVFYKFRSMHSDADSMIHREHVTTIIKGSKDTENSAANTAWSKLESDPRITPIGRVIRKTSIDELPQLFSVLKGDMSLVGPRPPLPYEAEVYEPWHLRRMLEIRPGITGLWQVGGRGRVSFDDMVRMDLRYIRDWSLALDFKILARTVKVVLRREGAT